MGQLCPCPRRSGSIVKDGHIAIPEAPGIGVELNMESVKRNARRIRHFRVSLGQAGARGDCLTVPREPLLR